MFSSVQSLSHVWLFATPWIAGRQASLSITNPQSSLRLMSIKLVMPSSHLILCRPLLLLPSIFQSIGVFSNKSTLCMRWPKYWSFSFSISPSIYMKYPESVNLWEKIVNLDCGCKNAHRNLGFDRNPAKLNCAILWHNSINWSIITELYTAMSEF